MKQLVTKKYSLIALVFCAVIFLNNSSSHPVSVNGGYTGAPNDSTCLNCHTTGDVDGTIAITGIPEIVNAGTTYPITVTISDTNGTAAKAGFQMVTLKTSTNGNSGTYSEPEGSTNVQVKNANSKSYIGHKSAKEFDANNSLTYNVDWTAPENQDGEEIKFYAAALIANGSNTNKRDKFVTATVTSTVMNQVSTDNELGSNIFIYPVPATDQLFVNSNTQNLTKIELFTMNGEKILQNSSLSKPVTELDISQLSSGNYIVTISNESNTISKLVVKK